MSAFLTISLSLICALNTGTPVPNFVWIKALVVSSLLIPLSVNLDALALASDKSSLALNCTEASFTPCV